MSPTRPVRSLGTLLLLALALVLVAVLAYQAQDAARSHQKTAERTLKDYASFANWQLTQQAKNNMLTNVVTTLIFAASRVDPAHVESLLDPEQVGALARQSGPWCECLGKVDFYFRYDWHDGTLRTTDTDLPDADLAWVRDTMVAHTKALGFPRDRVPLTFGSPDGRYGPLRQLAVILTNDSYAMVFGQRSGKQRLVVFAVARDTGGKPVVTYGYQTDPSAFVTPALRFIHERTPLLPPALLRDVAPDSALSISVSDIAGHEVYRSPGRFESAYSSSDTLTEAQFGRLVTNVRLRPEIADQLIVGGLPRSRLPILLGLFALTAGLLAMALVQMRRQAQLARLRTEFVSGVSHELRTPLAQIRWFAELLRMGKLRSEEERNRSASIIDQEARRLTYLVENVLNFSRSEKGTNRISPTVVDLEREIRDVLEIFAPLARSRRLTLQQELDLGVSVHADRDALRQIFLNLLDNAAKYGPTGQTITVTMQVVKPGTVRVAVEDQGPGIPEADRDRVWEPYIRLNRKIDSSTGGSGIGLSVVRELIQMHGGRTWMEPGPGGVGTRVVVELPLLRDSRPKPTSATENHSSGHPARAKLVSGSTVSE